MPRYYDNYDEPYYGDYLADYYPSYGTHRPPHSQQQQYQRPSNQVAPLEYHSRPRRRYSHSQVFDSSAPDYNYPSYITQPQYSGQHQRAPLPSQGRQQRPPSSQQQPSFPLSTETKAVGSKSAPRRGAYQSYPPVPTSLHLRQDPRMFQDQQHQYDSGARQRRSSTGSTWASGYPSSSYQMDTRDYDDDDDVTNSQDLRADGDSDDDDSLNSLEMLALENAKRNEKPPGGTPSPFDPDNLSIPLSAQIERGVNNNNQQQRTDPHQHQHSTNLTNDPTALSSPPVISSAGTLSDTLTDNTTSHHQQQQQQQQQESTKKRRWPLSYLFRKSSTGSNYSKTSNSNLFMTTPSPSNSLTSSNSSDFSSHTNDSQTNNTRHIPSTISTRQKQRQPQSQPSIVTYRSKLEAASAAAAAAASPRIEGQQQLGDAEMTALLDNIWCFKASQVAAQLLSPDNNSNVWTGFDYKNQEILTNHSIALMNDQAKTDPGVELFDSHIRKGSLPFLVMVSQKLAYYPTSNNTIDKIEIQCLPNTKETVLLRKKKLA